jgi:murein DD-endopeptidase MepM/ murein hydrolase activator NlpD
VRRTAGIGAILAACAGPAMAQPAPGTLQPPVAARCLSSPFGPRILPGLPKAGTYHWGIDMPAPAGGAVHAAAAGTVVAIRRRGAGGLEIILRHDGAPEPYETLYAHLGAVAPAFAEGKRTAEAGERLGVIGRTGVTYGTHVYFEVIQNNVRIDPNVFLKLPRCG